MVPLTSVLQQPFGDEVIMTWPIVDIGGMPVSSLPILLYVIRASDLMEFDWSTFTFVTAGTAVTPGQSMGEYPSGSGVYMYSWNLGTITNPTVDDVYEIIMSCSGAHGAAINAQNMVGEIRMWGPLANAVGQYTLSYNVPGSFSGGTAGAALGEIGDINNNFNNIPGNVMQAMASGPSGSLGDTVLRCRKMLMNRKVIAGQQLVVYDDDNTSIWSTFQLSDVNGGPITPGVGEPAQFA